MVDIDILELITNALAGLNLPVIYGWYDKNILETHITFLEFDNTENDFENDEATTEEHWIQVDIWTKDALEAQSLKKQVKTLLKSNSLSYEGAADQFETDTEIWHIATRWLYAESLN